MSKTKQQNGLALRLPLMRKLVFTLFFVFCLFLGAYSQKSDGTDSGKMRLSANMIMGKNFGGDTFFSDNVSFEYSKRLNPKVGIRLGANLGEISSSFLDECEDKAPYSKAHRRTSAYVGLDYVVNPKMLISFTAFFDNVNLNGMNRHFGASRLYTNGFNASMTYKFSNETLLSLSFTYIESNAPFMPYTPYPSYASPYSMHGFCNPLLDGFAPGGAFTSFWQP